MDEISRWKESLWKLAKKTVSNKTSAHLLSSTCPIVNNTKNLRLYEVQHDELDNILTLNCNKESFFLAFKFDKKHKEDFIFLLLDMNIKFMIHKDIPLIAIPLDISDFAEEDEDQIRRLLNFLRNKKKPFTLEFLMNRIPEHYTDEEFAKMKNLILRITPLETINISFNKMKFYDNVYHKDPFENQQIPSSFSFTIDESNEKGFGYDEEGKDVNQEVLEGLLFKKIVVGLNKKSFVVLEVNGVEAAVPIEMLFSLSQLRKEIAKQTGFVLLIRLQQKEWLSIIDKIKDELIRDESTYNTLIQTLGEFIKIVFLNDLQPCEDQSMVSGLRYYEDDDYFWVSYESLYSFYKEKQESSNLMFDIEIDSIGIKREGKLLRLGKSTFGDMIKEAKKEVIKKVKTEKAIEEEPESGVEGLEEVDLDEEIKRIGRNDG